MSGWLWKGWKAIDQASCWNEIAPTSLDVDDVMMVVGSRDSRHRRILNDKCAAGRSLYNNIVASNGRM